MSTCVGPGVAEVQIVSQGRVKGYFKQPPTSDGG